MDKAQELINHFEDLRNDIYSYFYREKIKLFTLKQWRQYQLERTSSHILKNQDAKDDFNSVQHNEHQQVLDSWEKLQTSSYELFFPLIEVFNSYTIKFLIQQVKKHKINHNEMLDVLLIAAEHNQVKLVETIFNILKENSYNENIIYHTKCKLIKECSKTYALDVLNLCLDKEFDKSWKDINDNLSKDDFLMMSFLYKNKKVPIEKNQDYFLSACLHNRIEIIQEAIKNGQSLDILQNNSYSYWIHCKMNVQTLQFFLQKKFNFHRKISVSNPVYHAEQFLNNTNIETFRYLIQNNCPQIVKNECLIRAIALHKQDEVDFLIEQGADIYYDDGLALFTSIYNKNIFMSHYLLNNNISYKKHYQEILINLVRQNDIELLTYFIEEGNPLYELYNNDYNLLKTACEEENLPIVRLLIQKGFPVYHYRYEAFLIAIENKNVDILHCLLNELNDKQLYEMKEVLTKESERHPHLINTLWNDISNYIQYRYLNNTLTTQSNQKKPKL